MQLWFKAFHIIFMVTWFAGIFYLPRLFVYHSECSDEISLTRFKIMERRLFWGIMTPGAILTTIFGFDLLGRNLSFYMQAPWMHAKLGLVALLWIYHIYCGFLMRDFKHDKNTHSRKFYAWLNELPALILFGVVILVIVRPF